MALLSGVTESCAAPMANARSAANAAKHDAYVLNVMQPKSGGKCRVYPAEGNLGRPMGGLPGWRGVALLGRR